MVLVQRAVGEQDGGAGQRTFLAFMENRLAAAVSTSVNEASGSPVKLTGPGW